MCAHELRSSELLPLCYCVKCKAFCPLYQSHRETLWPFYWPSRLILFRLWWASESIWPGECHSIVVSRPIVRDLFTTFLGTIERGTRTHTHKFGVARQYIASTKFVQLCDRQINLFSPRAGILCGCVGSSVRARDIQIASSTGARTRCGQTKARALE